ncbi:hypothetical protein FNF31_02633 [Cafeteria roenbergensis]|nr:hypothetical protein FNF31_02633 [Cafeteria roenbergensis]KAA0171356.1 hypothetical protein FNF28_00847 [Cafeteria roenbergensis]
MDESPLYSAEQIRVPDALPDVIKQWTKAVIRAKPEDVVAWSAEYFAKCAAERAEEVGIEVEAPTGADGESKGAEDE